MNARTMAEFNRQVDNLLKKSYPKAAGISVTAFLELIEPLRKSVARIPVIIKDPAHGRLSFVIVIKSDLVSADTAMKLVEREGKRGIIMMQPVEPQQFTSIDGVDIPGGMAYLLADIDRGRESLNVRPSDALKTIRTQRRSPLTIDEGVAVLTHFPEFLQKNNCFSLLASRRGDQRVPALWISGEKNPKLGWCWDGNPHTWLGSASCGSRIGLELPKNKERKTNRTASYRRSTKAQRHPSR
jgi:hypothetical protein